MGLLTGFLAADTWQERTRMRTLLDSALTEIEDRMSEVDSESRRIQRPEVR